MKPRARTHVRAIRCGWIGGRSRHDQSADDTPPHGTRRRSRAVEHRGKASYTLRLKASGSVPIGLYRLQPTGNLSSPSLSRSNRPSRLQRSSTRAATCPAACPC
jgi:hypothetical protein